MTLLADNPVFQREARWGCRLRRLGRNRPLAVMVAAVALAVGWLYWRGLWAYVNSDTTYDNHDPWRLCSNVSLAILVLLAPALASSAIAQEKEQQTWEVLATTRLTPTQILLGKWLGRLVLIGWITLVLLPLLLISAGGAGLPPVMILLVFGFFALNAALYGMIGLTCSFVARKTLAATTAALVITALLCLGTWVADQLIGGLFRGDWVMMRYSGFPSPLWGNPFYVLEMLSRPPGASIIDVTSSSGTDDARPVPPDVAGVLGAYVVTSLFVIAVCFYYMFTRYRRAVRGGRPLGEPLT